MRARLAQDFVTAWVAGRDLEPLVGQPLGPELGRLCTLLREHYAYPVDSLLLTPELEILGHLNAHEPRARSAAGYLAFLDEGLARARGEPWPAPPPAPAASPRSDSLRPTPLEPTASRLDLFPAARTGQPALRYIPFDLGAFPAGGTLEVSLYLGETGAAGRFELCASAPGQPDVTQPVRVQERVAPGERVTLTLEFEPGRGYGLAVMAAAGVTEGAQNAFVATVNARGRS